MSSRKSTLTSSMIWDASLVPEKDLAREDGLVWYLPHHGVIHPRKNKRRVVLDASARFIGTSLNDCLLSGPDLTNSLIGVLNRFCQDRVALMADLECMFYSVKVPIEQRDLIRFLWWPDGDVRNQVVECHMHTHIFGATSSPAVATYALQKMGRDNASDFKARISPDKPPFFSTGVDFFGPILVKWGRSLVKRYGALFTCLVSRAVYIEMAAALDTDSFINVLRRFLARHGQVNLIRSDYGSNLVGAEKELGLSLHEWNQAQNKSFLLQKGISWNFNTPTLFCVIICMFCSL